CDRLFGNQTVQHSNCHGMPEDCAVNGARGLTDDEVLAKARNARNYDKFSRLWSGDTNDYEGDESCADLALCISLAFWTRDPRQVDRLFRRSGLYRPKWDERRGETNYGKRTIEQALKFQKEQYRGNRGVANASANGQANEVDGKREQERY